ncbi:MAG: diphosphomevalonate decarboxylase, partial [Candidatus Korarchaeota archaeon]|nr:diphosphomevalonate decarboxylase [Candidatus Korarchaeota archaeon]NIU83890.1 diphosphomevalonate decarboxylase [Candidatus Thorarchaeota archaeon]NIW52130.1 diphosphomevalonate decarboxylase [Candidatus Korarchaeota archaeon]
MKATAIAHPIQGLIKYHGLKDTTLRLPFHDSVSVCAGALRTITTVESAKSSKKDLVVINGRRAAGADLARVEAVLDKIRSSTAYSGCFKIVSKNSTITGKGLGFSAS